MSFLNPKQIAAHCERLLDAVTGIVQSRYGDNGAEYAGECLFQALTLFDSDHGDVDAWAREKTCKLVLDRLRKFHGRKGTAVGEARRKTASFDPDFEQADGSEAEDSPMERRESLTKAFSTIKKVRNLPRWILLGRMLGDMNNSDLKRILDVSERQLCRETSALRQLLSPN